MIGVYPAYGVMVVMKVVVWQTALSGCMTHNAGEAPTLLSASCTMGCAGFPNRRTPLITANLKVTRYSAFQERLSIAYTV